MKTAVISILFIVGLIVGPVFHFQKKFSDEGVILETKARELRPYGKYRMVQVEVELSPEMNPIAFRLYPDYDMPRRYKTNSAVFNTSLRQGDEIVWEKTWEMGSEHIGRKRMRRLHSNTLKRFDIKEKGLYVFEMDLVEQTKDFVRVIDLVVQRNAVQDDRNLVVGILMMVGAVVAGSLPGRKKRRPRA